jgi:glycosyltransferase involved in cell wall biosynthesis
MAVAFECYRNMFRHYDIVQCYATEPIFGLLLDQHPLVAFEHGTLRAFTMEDVPLHRLTALGYRKSDHVFITNGDCLAYAKRLGIGAYSPMIHPIDVEQHRRDYGDAISALRKDVGADVILLCPTRHDWDIKGTDRFIRALPLIKQRTKGRVKLILVRWGLHVAESEALISALGCQDDVVWRTTMSRVTMIKHMRAADIVLDQMVLPVFGSTGPQAIAAGRPVISSYVPEETRWLISEPAPILSAFSPDDVAAAVATALDPAWLADYRKRAQEWTDRYHHPDNAVLQHLDVYRRLLEGERQNDVPAPLDAVRTNPATAAALPDA